MSGKDNPETSTDKEKSTPMDVGVEEPRGQKRKVTEILVDPDTKDTLPNPKSSKVEMSPDLKIKCLKLLIEGYKNIRDAARNQNTTMKVDTLGFSHAVTSVIFTVHNTKRTECNDPNFKSNMATKAGETDFTFTQRGTQFHLTRADAIKAWDNAVDKIGLTYSKNLPDKDNWIGTIGPYLNMVGSWGYRLQELRVGHTKMPIGKTPEGAVKYVQLERYGLDAAHGVLLEGVTYPPERKSSMAMSVGPLTAALTMISSENKYRKKWENAVKKMMSHCPLIDDFITLTKKEKSSHEVSVVLRMYADILLLTTSRQTQRANLPLGLLVQVYDLEVKAGNGDAFLKFFNCSGEGLFYTYKKVCEDTTTKWKMETDMTSEAASQVAFHCIFGTYKEDFGILSSITNVATWYNRETIGADFKKTKKRCVDIKWPTLKYYAKLCSANQSGMLASLYSQVSSIPCFSGNRTVKFTDDFFVHMNRRKADATNVRSLNDMIFTLDKVLKELIAEVEEKGREVSMGSKDWQDMSGLALDKPGKAIDNLSFATSGAFFMGRSLKKKST